MAGGGGKIIENIAMEFFVYVIFSKKLNRYYVGQTSNVTKRIEEHNEAKAKYTSKGIPWELVATIQINSRTEAIKLELKIKKRGIRRYLVDNDLL